MSQNDGLNRRTFLKNAGMTALVGAVGSGTSVATAAAGLAVAASNAKFDFDTPYNRFGTDSTKYDQQARVYGKENIQVGMGIADMDFRAAPSITKALTERLQHENWGYLDMGGPAMKSFTEGIVSWNKRRYGVDINPDLMVITTGVHPGLIAALKTFSPPGSKVILQTPTYNGFYSDLTAAGTIEEANPLKLVNGRYSMDFEDLERRISHDTNSLILCNPQNPTGNCWSKEDLLRLGEICTRRRVVVLADEIHCDFVTKGNKYTPYASIGNKEIVNNSLTFKAASKSFGLAAMKCAWFYSDNADYVATGEGQQPRRSDDARDDCQQGRVRGRRGVAQRVQRVHRRQPRLRRVVHQGQHSDDQGRTSRRARICRGWTSARWPTRSTPSSWPLKPTRASSRGPSRSRPSRWSSATS